MGKKYNQGKSGSSIRYCEPFKTIVMTRCYIRECLFLLFLDLYRKTQILFSSFSCVEDSTVCSANIQSIQM